MQMFTAAVFVMPPNWKDPRCPVSERTDKQTVSHPCPRTWVSRKKDPVSLTHAAREGCVPMFLYRSITDPLGCIKEAEWEILAKDTHTVTGAVADSVLEGLR